MHRAGFASERLLNEIAVDFAGEESYKKVKGLMIMKNKAVIILVTLFLVFTLLPEDSPGEVKGNCSNCHTMHRSQALWPWDMNWGGPGSAPVENLLAADCLGCHTNYTDDATTITLGSGAGQVTVPIVYNVASSPADMLAGGNFYWVGQGDDAKGHNVMGIAGQDATLSVAPGNVNSCANTCHYSLAVEQHTLPALGSGCRGCHLNAAHHAKDSATVVSEAGGWYRFLSGHMSGDGYGVEGIEDTDWQATESSGDHNEYLGLETGLSGSGGFSNLGHTVTAFCCGCHGNFHKEQDSFSWLRHPSDAAIPNYGEFADAFGAGGTGAGTYDPNIPVARPALTSVSNIVNIGTDIVMCLTCHRPHGSPYFKMLRWDYRGNDWSGCGTCHTRKQ